MKTLVALILVLPFLLAHAQTPKMSKRDKEYKSKNLKNLGPRQGYQGNKDWDNFISMAGKYQDKEILIKMLQFEPVAPTERAQYQHDLYSVYKESPAFFVETAYGFFNKDMDCVVRQLVSEPAIITPEEIKSPLPKKYSSKVLSEFAERVKSTDMKSEPVKTRMALAEKCSLLKSKNQQKVKAGTPKKNEKKKK